MPVTSAVFVRATIASLLVGLTALLAIVGSSLWLVSRTDSSAEALVTMQQFRRHVFEVVIDVQEAETGQRGYLLTLQRSYLQPYMAARQNLIESIDRLSRFGERLPRYTEKVTLLTREVETKLQELADTLELVDAGRLADAIAVVRTGRGQAVMEAIKAIEADIIEMADADLAVFSGETREYARTLMWALLAGGIVIIGVVGASTAVAWRYTRDLDRARATVQDLNASLEERVKERTGDLQRANEEIQRFAYIVSHDLRAPLVNIMGFTSELETGLATIRERFAQLPANDDAQPDDARIVVEEEMPEAIGFIRSSTSKMDNLINAILKLSREGRRTLNPERIDMAALLENTAASVHHQIVETDGVIAVETPLPDVVSDRLALEQIFGNLVDNAVKYADPSRPISIKLRGRQVGFHVVYEVEDNGRGIAKEDQERVFELFRRAGAQDKAGEGIGLSHVRALARRLGGDVDLESTLGRGTTFRVRLPKSLPYALRESSAK